MNYFGLSIEADPYRVKEITYIFLYWVYELFQPKSVTFSTRALILVHFKTVHYFSQPIFGFFIFKKLITQFSH